MVGLAWAGAIVCVGIHRSLIMDFTIALTCNDLCTTILLGLPQCPPGKPQNLCLLSPHLSAGAGLCETAQVSPSMTALPLRGYLLLHYPTGLY